MRTRYLVGILAVLVLVLAVWLVPMALAEAGGAPAPDGQSSPVSPHGSAAECPYLQAHPWMDPHGTSGGSGGTGGASYDVIYY